MTDTATRRDLLAGAGAAAGLALVPLGAAAQQGEGVAQVAGVVRRGVGDVVVTALLDGYLPLDLELLSGIEPARANQLLREAFASGRKVDTSINAYVIRSGDRTIMVDGGAGSVFGGTAGHLGEAMRAAGVEPGEVDTVFATHAHPDHVGLFQANGEATFPGAELVLHEDERAFWSDDANFANAGEQTKNFARIARNALGAYEGRVRTIRDGARVAPGVTAMALPGHTPGHTGLMIESNREALLLWGDIVHVGPVQFAAPDVTIAFDVDPDQAAATRTRVMDMVATDRLAFAGSHVDFPSFGHLVKAGEGYGFVHGRWDHRL
jgi:glyoxylase-like metal-dependent hydrolase (beta-lactamase superfamily II)